MYKSAYIFANIIQPDNKQHRVFIIYIYALVFTIRYTYIFVYFQRRHHHHHQFVWDSKNQRKIFIFISSSFFSSCLKDSSLQYIYIYFSFRYKKRRGMVARRLSNFTLLAYSPPLAIHILANI